MRPELNLEDEVTQQLIKQAESRRNQLPAEIVTDGRTYICIFDLKPPDLPDKLKINQRVLLRGERVLASGESVEASHDWMSGKKIVIGTLLNSTLKHILLAIVFSEAFYTLYMLICFTCDWA